MSISPTRIKNNNRPKIDIIEKEQPFSNITTKYDERDNFLSSKTKKIISEPAYNIVYTHPEEENYHHHHHKRNEISLNETFRPKKKSHEYNLVPSSSNKNDIEALNNYFFSPNSSFVDENNYTGISSLNNRNNSSPIRGDENSLLLSENEKLKKILEEVLKNQKDLYKKLNLDGKNLSSEKETEDLEKLPEDEKKKKRLELIDELIKYNSNNPNFQIPYDNCSLNYLNEITSRYRKKYNRQKGKWYIEAFLQFVFWGTEKGLLRCNIDASGFCEFQTKHLNKYESLINEVTDIYFSEETGELKLSPTQRFLIFIVVQFILFIGFKYFGGNPIIKNMLNIFDSSITNSLTNSSSITEETNSSSNKNNNSSSSSNSMISNMMSGLFNNFSNNNNSNITNTSTVNKNTTSPSFNVVKTPVMVPPPVHPSQNGCPSPSTKRESPKKRRENKVD